MKRDLYISDSKISGKGIFTKRAFKKGDTIFILKGKKKYLKINGPKDSMVGPNWIGIGKEMWLDPEEKIAKFLNHSCDPNVGVKGTVTVVARKNIKSGEELTIDYSIIEDDVYWKMVNTEKIKNQSLLRKEIRSIQFLPKNIYNKYTPYIPRYFQKVYNEYHKTGGDNKKTKKSSLKPNKK